MAYYARFLGRKVTVSYRVGEILVPASGTFVGDSGRSIFLEQHIEQRGRISYFRWEIPYQHLHRIAELEAEVSDSDGNLPTEHREDTHDVSEDAPQRPSAMAARASSAGPTLLPLSHRTKTA